MKRTRRAREPGRGRAGATVQRSREPRDRPPTPGPVRDVAFPPVVRRRLANGLSLVAVEHRTLPRATFVASMGLGDRDDPDGRTGLATLTTRLLKEGTVHRTAVEIADAIESVGGSIGVSVDMDHSRLSVQVLTAHMPLALDLLADLIQFPTFHPEELSIVRGRMEQELAATRSDPEFLAEELAARVMYGSHPYGTVAPTMATLAAITRRDVQRLHVETTVPDQATVVAVGDFIAGHILDQLERHLGGWEAGVSSRATLPAPRRQRAARVHVLDRPEAVQSVIHVVAPAVNRASPDFIPLEVMNRILGGGTSSRLFQNLRQQHGYTYGASSQLSQMQLASELVAGASVRTDVTELALEEIERELTRLSREPLPAGELEQVKQEMIGHFPLALESQRAIAGRLLSIEMFRLADDYWDHYRSSIAAVSEDDVRRVARAYAHPSRFKVIVVGQAKRIARPLADFGQVQISDRDGR